MTKVHCRNCGNKIYEEAVICPKCGVAQRKVSRGKSKQTALLLSIFVGSFTFLYSYEKDASKFWALLITSIVGLFFLLIPTLIAYIYGIVVVSKRTEEWYEQLEG